MGRLSETCGPMAVRCEALEETWKQLRVEATRQERKAKEECGNLAEMCRELLEEAADNLASWQRQAEEARQEEARQEEARQELEMRLLTWEKALTSTRQELKQEAEDAAELRNKLAGVELQLEQRIASDIAGQADQFASVEAEQERLTLQLDGHAREIQDQLDRHLLLLRAQAADSAREADALQALVVSAEDRVVLQKHFQQLRLWRERSKRKEVQFQLLHAQAIASSLRELCDESLDLSDVVELVKEERAIALGRVEETKKSRDALERERKSGEERQLELQVRVREQEESIRGLRQQLQATWDKERALQVKFEELREERESTTLASASILAQLEETQTLAGACRRDALEDEQRLQQGMESSEQLEQLLGRLEEELTWAVAASGGAGQAGCLSSRVAGMAARLVSVSNESLELSFAVADAERQLGELAFEEQEEGRHRAAEKARGGWWRLTLTLLLSYMQQAARRREEKLEDKQAVIEASELRRKELETWALEEKQKVAEKEAEAAARKRELEVLRAELEESEAGRMLEKKELRRLRGEEEALKRSLLEVTGELLQAQRDGLSRTRAEETEALAGLLERGLQGCEEKASLLEELLRELSVGRTRRSANMRLLASEAAADLESIALDLEEAKGENERDEERRRMRQEDVKRLAELVGESEGERERRRWTCEEMLMELTGVRSDCLRVFAEMNNEWKECHDQVLARKKRCEGAALPFARNILEELNQSQEEMEEMMLQVRQDSNLRLDDLGSLQVSQETMLVAQETMLVAQETMLVAQELEKERKEIARESKINDDTRQQLAALQARLSQALVKSEDLADTVRASSTLLEEAKEEQQQVARIVSSYGTRWNLADGAEQQLPDRLLLLLRHAQRLLDAQRQLEQAATTKADQQEEERLRMSADAREAKRELEEAKNELMRVQGDNRSLVVQCNQLEEEAAKLRAIVEDEEEGKRLGDADSLGQ
eukprot:768217-Hanusia_phi.AAC.1